MWPYTQTSQYTKIKWQSEFPKLQDPNKEERGGPGWGGGGTWTKSGAYQPCALVMMNMFSKVPFKLLSEAMRHIYVYTCLEVTRGRNAISIMKS